MPTPINELVDELARLKPGSPAYHQLRDVFDGIEWWNSLYPTERTYWLSVARETTAAEAWRAFKLARAFDAVTAACAREFGRELTAQ